MSRTAPLVLIGLDGATWDVAASMIRNGELPNLQTLVQRGSRGALWSFDPLSSPVVWTTIATGRFPREHNVLHFLAPYTQGPWRVVRSTDRRVPALWNIASHYGRTVGSIGYYASYPPEVVNGFMVSDWLAEGHPHSVFPEDLLTTMPADLMALQDKGEFRERLRRLLPWDFDPSALEREDDPYHSVTRIIGDKIDAQLYKDELHVQMATRLLERDVDLFLAYFKIIDHASHVAWKFHDGTDFQDKPKTADQELLGDLVRSSYRYVDDALGRLLKKIGDDTNILIVSDHGFGSATGKWTIANGDGRLSGNHRTNGFFLAAGPDIRPGEVRGLTTLDITPTILALLGLPIEEDLPGRVDRNVLREGFLQDHPLKTTQAYEPDRTLAYDASIDDRDGDEKAIRKLADLGYLSASTEVADSHRETGDFWSILPHFIVSALVGEGAFYTLREDEEALRGLERIVQQKAPELWPRIRDGMRSWMGDYGH